MREAARQFTSRANGSSDPDGDACALTAQARAPFAAGQGAKAQKIVLKKQAPTLGPAA